MIPQKLIKCRRIHQDLEIFKRFRNTFEGKHTSLKCFDKNSILSTNEFWHTDLICDILMPLR